jgi:O-antigen/teichoic acid export membrane protein
MTAHERFVFRQGVDTIFTIAVPIVNLTALYMGFASVGMAFTSLLVQIAMTAVHVFYCLRRLKLRPVFTMLPKKLVREMCGFSLFVFLATVSDMLFWATDKVILGILASTAAVAVYNVGGTFNSIVMSLSTSITGVLVPKITGMVTANTPKEEWSNLMIRVGRLQFLIIGLVVSGFAVFGRAFVALWAGPDYAGSFWVAVLTLFPLCIPLIQNTALNVVTAQNKHQFRSVMYFCIAVCNAVSTYLVVPYLGVIGAALCTCASYLLGQGLILNIYYYKVTGLDIPLFWKNILKMAIVPGTMLVMGLALTNCCPMDNWVVFFAGVVIYTLVYVAAMYLLAMNDYEKDIVRKPMRKISCVLRKE